MMYGSSQMLTCGDTNALEVGEHKACALVGGCYAGKEDGYDNAPCKGTSAIKDQ